MDKCLLTSRHPVVLYNGYHLSHSRFFIFWPPVNPIALRMAKLHRVLAVLSAIGLDVLK